MLMVNHTTADESVHNIISRRKNQHDYVKSEARGKKLLGARDACTREN